MENLSPDRQMRLTMHVSSGGANSEAADHAVANFTKNRSINTGIGLAPGEKGTMRLLLPHPEVYATPDGAPGPFLVDTHRVNAIELQCQWPFEDEFRWVVDCRLSGLRLEGEPAAPFPRGAAFFPFIDRYGQFRHAEWPEKVHSDAELRADLAREEAALAASPRPASWDRFGGWKDGPRLRATGAFRTELVDGKWWLVTPEGHLFFSTGIDVVRDNTDSSDGSKHPDWHETPVPPSKSMAYPAWNLRKKFGKDDYLADYYAFVQRRLPAWGINTVGNWAGRELLCAAAMTYVLSLGENEKSIPHVPGGLKFYDCFDENFVPALASARTPPRAARAPIRSASGSSSTTSCSSTRASRRRSPRRSPSAPPSGSCSAAPTRNTAATASPRSTPTGGRPSPTGRPRRRFPPSRRGRAGRTSGTASRPSGSSATSAL